LASFIGSTAAAAFLEAIKWLNKWVVRRWREARDNRRKVPVEFTELAGVTAVPPPPYVSVQPPTMTRPPPLHRAPKCFAESPREFTREEE
jgi:hypothetical protein